MLENEARKARVCHHLTLFFQAYFKFFTFNFERTYIGKFLVHSTHERIAAAMGFNLFYCDIKSCKMHAVPYELTSPTSWRLVVSPAIFSHTIQKIFLPQESLFKDVRENFPIYSKIFLYRVLKRTNL